MRKSKNRRRERGEEIKEVGKGRESKTRENQWSRWSIKVKFPRERLKDAYYLGAFTYHHG